MRRMRRRRGMISAVLLAALLSLGWGGTWEEIREGAGRIQSIRADFIQEKHLKILAEPLISEGIFYFRMDDDLRWEYTAPIQSVLLMHNGDTRRYIRGKDGWMGDDTARLQAMQVVLGEITNWLNGRFDENPGFIAALEPDRKIILTPKAPAMAAVISRITLHLSDTPGLMEAVTIHEGADSFTRLIFQNARLNPPIEDAVFQTVK